MNQSWVNEILSPFFNASGLYDSKFNKILNITTQSHILYKLKLFNEIRRGYFFISCNKTERYKIFLC